MDSQEATAEQNNELLLEDSWPAFIPEPDSDTFSTKLFRLIDQQGLEDADVKQRGK